MELNPQIVFERMFGVGSTAQERAARAQEDRSLLDELTEEIADLRRKLGTKDRAKLSEYFDSVRDVEQRIDFADMAEKLIAEPLAFASPFNQPGDVTHFERAVGGLLGFEDVGERDQARIGHQRDAGVRIDRGEGIVRRQRAAAGERVEHRRLADVRQPDHAATESHNYRDA